ncbi:hypothetical protein PK98_12495 [Croceibacterium mercuriale]|uniref:DUF885 domain-containing protein n=2 Tax=Croceibacterium mercuriale TaxID=1572751 RepID=A0A0B2BZK2_9SPHN|nr:hypothetical protein PK98_12495 [Croceibacterium mercuriale]
MPLFLPFAAMPALAQEASATSVAASRTDTDADARLRALYEREWAWRQEQFARITDASGGDKPADHLPRVDPAVQAARLAYWQAALAELDAIPVDRLSEEEQVNAAVLRTSLEAFVADGRYRGWEMPLNADSNFWSYLAEQRPLADAEEYRRYLGRMRDVPRYFDEQIANMRAGLARGFSVPRVTLAGRDASIAAHAVAGPQDNPFWAPFAAMPASIPAAEQAALRAEAERAIGEAVVPAYTKLLAFFRDEYLPGTRTTLAARDLPDGAAYYAAQIREYTTLDLSAEEIHAIGLAEVARIEAEMQLTMAEAGHTGTFAEFLQFLRTDPRFIARDGDELLGYAALVSKRADGELKNVIGRLPRYRFTILPVPDAIAPFYTAGRGGLEACYMNTHDLPSRPLYNIPALVLHECNPGHSLQAALALEGPARPAFRRQAYFSGYGEGWGLYVEWLGTSMGIYRTPYERFGRQTYEMWRAARLVIDTGVHHHGWSREQAIAYLADRTALSRHEVETEVDRYISWPGQALAYKLGELTLRRKRADAEAALGAGFDQRRFHDLVLDLGSVPLPVLEARIDRWIAAGGPAVYPEEGA